MSNPTPTPTGPAPVPYEVSSRNAGTNLLAILALVGAFVFPIVGIICGHIALVQLKRTGEKGRGLAIAGLVIGYLYIAVVVIVTFLVAIFAASAPTTY